MLRHSRLFSSDDPHDEPVSDADRQQHEVQGEGQSEPDYDLPSKATDSDCRAHDFDNACVIVGRLAEVSELLAIKNNALPGKLPSAHSAVNSGKEAETQVGYADGNRLTQVFDSWQDPLLVFLRNQFFKCRG